MIRLIYWSAIILIGVVNTQALSVKENALKNAKLFAIEFPESSRRVLAKANALSGLSMHDYISPPFKVVELTINMQGQGLLRIYHTYMLDAMALKKALDPAQTTPTIKQRFGPPMGQALQRIEQKMTPIVDILTPTTVIKEYPHATHAKTIEFRIGSQSELLELYQALLQQWGGENVDDSGPNAIEKNGDKQNSSGSRKLGGCLFTVEN